ncbi:MAG: hypothetical protein R2823_00070 [Acidimicrobiia bacterium]
MRRRIIVTLAVLAVIALLPQIAVAQEADPQTSDTTAEQRVHPVDAIKRRAAEAIHRRLEALDRLGVRVRTDDHVTDGHAAQLTKHYARAAEGLTELGREIAAATSHEELRELVPLIATDYRVYLVIIPKSHEVLVSDHMADAADRLSDAAAVVLAAIERAEQAGYDMTEARHWLGVARDEITAVIRGAVPVADKVVGLTAADWEEPAKTLLTNGRAALRQGREDLHDAIRALGKARDAIADAIG